MWFLVAFVLVLVLVAIVVTYRNRDKVDTLVQQEKDAATRAKTWWDSIRSRFS